MARPLKQGLDYYPLDCYFLDDIKIRKILRANGSGSIAVLIDLLSNIYRDEGYYMQWDDDICFLVADKVGTSEASVSEVVKKALQVEFFNQELFKKYKILTSRGIQSRFLEAASRRKEVTLYQEYLLTNEVHEYKNTKIVTETELGGVNVYNNSVNVDNNEQSKVKESKVKKSKVKESADMRDTNITKQGRNSASVSKSPLPSQTDNDYGKVSRFYQENFGMLSAYLAQDLEYEVSDMGADLVIEAMKRALVNNKNYSYARNILRNWRQKGVKTLEDAEAETVAFKKSKQATQGKKRLRRQEQIPDWLDDYQQQGGSVPKNKTEKEPADSDDDSLDDLKAMRESWKQMLNSDKSNDKANDKSKEKINDG